MADRNLGLVVAGGVALVAGAAALSLVPIGIGMRGMERAWRERHGFQGTWGERWARSERFYEGTHQNRTNRGLHMVGMPFIVGGTLGLMVSSPLLPITWPVYAMSTASFVGGWALNLVGHAAFEKNGPAFADDPLSFLAGPAWELGLLRRRLAGVTT